MHIPTLNTDFFSEEVILDPYDVYAELRDTGEAVWLQAQGVWGVGTYSGVQAVLKDSKTFLSGKGVTLNPEINSSFAGNLLMDDDPDHRRKRMVFSRPIMGPNLAALEDRIQQEAKSLVSDLLARGSFDGVTDFALHLPVTVVADLVGLGEEGRGRMLEWAAASFDAFGPVDKDRTQAAMASVKDLQSYARGLTIDRLKPDGWAAKLFYAADDGKLTAEEAMRLVMSYVIPSLDTTVNATSTALLYLANNPAAWDRLRADPELAETVIAEAIRLETPIRFFAREVAYDTEFGGVTMKAGERVIVFYASANRDPKVFENPEIFSLDRKNAKDHLGFGHGVHICAGMHLARMEMRNLWKELANRVSKIEVGAPDWNIHNSLRGLKSLPATIST